MDSRTAFKTLYGRARQIEKTAGDSSAYMITDFAERDVIDDNPDVHYSVFLDVSKAVLWAIHWTRKPARADMPRWASERHLAFHLGPTESRVWFERPRLP